MIDEICNAIDLSTFVVADLTSLNHNVLFELGYALMKQKHIWPTVDLSFHQYKSDFEQFRIFTTLGWTSSKNHYEIVNGFYRDRPYEATKPTLYEMHVGRFLRLEKRQHLLYLKSRHQIQASVEIDDEVASLRYPVVIDDPLESTARSLSWYAQNVHNSYAVACHFTNFERDDATVVNARYALIAGMAFAESKPLLMLSEGDTSGSIDFRDIWLTYQSASEARSKFRDWFAPIKESIKSSEDERRDYHLTLRSNTNLGKLKIGDIAAENDVELLIDTFVKTQAYIEAVEGRDKIFIGRKGTGKTATLLKIKSEQEKEKDCVVCVIKPPEVDLRSFVELTKPLVMSRKLHVINALWRFLILTELALSIERHSSVKPLWVSDVCADALTQVLNGEHGLFRQPFSTRLHSFLEVSQREARLAPENAEDGRDYLAEVTFKGPLNRLLIAIKNAIAGKRKVLLLIDNLDKAWDREADLKDLSLLLFGLLGIISRVTDELRLDNKGIDGPKVSLSLFLRSDIFFRIRQYAAEADKIPFSQMNWTDADSLCRVLEERCYSSDGTLNSPANMWQKYCDPNICGLEPRQFIAQTVLPRPRDVIYLFGSALESAVNGGHSRITESDFIAARKKYSYYALDSIAVESELPNFDLRDICLEFLGASEIIDYKEILSRLKSGGISREEVPTIVRELCLLSFLGVETDDDVFAFVDDPRDFRKLEVLVRRRTGGNIAKQRYKINQPFQAYLDIIAS